MKARVIVCSDSAAAGATEDTTGPVLVAGLRELGCEVEAPVVVPDDVEEIIIATNASVEGESTALFLQRSIQEAGLTPTMSRLARGIPVGVDLEYADQITLTHALEGRRAL